jgi:hypothetical protein
MVFERETSVGLELTKGSQVNHGAQVQLGNNPKVVWCQSEQPVSAVNHSPLRGPAVCWITTEVTKIVDCTKGYMAIGMQQQVLKLISIHAARVREPLLTTAMCA